MSSIKHKIDGILDEGEKKANQMGKDLLRELKGWPTISKKILAMHVKNM